MAQHLERMMRGADFLKIKCPFMPKELQDFAGQLIKKNKMPEAVLRVTLTRGPGERGYTPQIDSQPTVVMTLHTAPPVDVKNPVQWRLITSSYRIPAGDPLSSFKTANKLIHILARMEAVEKGVDEALLVNTNGEVAETAGGNLFWVYQDNICTVPTGCGVLPGITRSVVLEICQTLGQPVNKCIIKPKALRIPRAFSSPRARSASCRWRRWTASQLRRRRWWCKFRALTAKCLPSREHGSAGCQPQVLEFRL
jgi:branched-chain amino acid aminotransferase